MHPPESAVLAPAVKDRGLGPHSLQRTFLGMGDISQLNLSGVGKPSPRPGSDVDHPHSTPYCAQTPEGMYCTNQ